MVASHVSHRAKNCNGNRRTANRHARDAKQWQWVDIRGPAACVDDGASANGDEGPWVPRIHREVRVSACGLGDFGEHIGKGQSEWQGGYRNGGCPSKASDDECPWVACCPGSNKGNHGNDRKQNAELWFEDRGECGEDCAANSLAADERGECVQQGDGSNGVDLPPHS